MIPGNVDPRRPDKVQRYKPNASGNSNAPGEDLTPDYMNILGPDSTTGNVQGDNKVNENIKNAEAKPSSNQQQTVQALDDATKSKPEAAPANTTNASNVIPTSNQYGVAIIPTTTTNDIPAETTTSATDTITESTAKTSENENKDMHSTPSKNDRFKVVKIASSEPFRRGRWKCMDYVDQTPPVTSQQTKTTTQGATTVQLAGNVYMQTQSLPPQQIQQLLLQGALASAGAPPQFYQSNLQSQMIPQAQYFYPAVQNQGNVPQQIINPSVVPPNSVQPQFINPTQQQYFQPSIIPQNYQNVQFVQQAYQNQNSAFVPTTQNIQSLQQQAQSYAGQPAVTQQNVAQSQAQSIPATQPQPLVNGYAYSPQNITDQQIAANNLPTQVAKNVILNSNPVNQVVQNQVVQNQSGISLQNQQESQQNSVPRTVPLQNQQLPAEQQNPTTYQQPQVPQNINPVLQNINPLQNVVVIQSYDPTQATDVYTNPQFVASVHSLPTVEQSDVQVSEGGAEAGLEAAGGNPDDPAKTNPVVNAIDNKIEQAMDLVKSHLMYTVREEVEVLKEKIAELMEKIQQLESENNFLRSQISKSNPNSNGTSEPSPQQ